jgi:hypothetical protein
MNHEELRKLVDQRRALMSERGLAQTMVRKLWLQANPLRCVLDDRGLKLEDAALKCGVPLRTLRRDLDGSLATYTVRLNDYAEALDISPLWLDQELGLWHAFRPSGTLTKAEEKEVRAILEGTCPISWIAKGSGTSLIYVARQAEMPDLQKRIVNRRDFTSLELRALADVLEVEVGNLCTLFVQWLEFFSAVPDWEIPMAAARYANSQEGDPYDLPDLRSASDGA